MTCLEVGTTCVYREKIPSDISSLQKMATEAERGFVANVKSLHRQAEMILTRILLREIFGDDVVYSHDENGAPIVNRDCFISVSHCADEVVIALNSTSPIGIDIEVWREQLARVFPRVMSPAEVKFYNTKQLMLQAWTAKEAIYKAVGIPGLDFSSEILLPLDPTDLTASVKNGISDTISVALIFVEVSSQKVITLASKI